jgi:hypothetical protein
MTSSTVGEASPESELMEQSAPERDPPVATPPRTSEEVVRKAASERRSGTAQRTIVIREDEEEETGRLGAWLVHGFMIFAAFAAGLLAGILIDGNAEIMNAYNTANRTYQNPRTAMLPEQPVDPSASQRAEPEGPIAQNAAYPDNNFVKWAVSVAPGTPTGTLVLRNNSVTRNARIDLLMVATGSNMMPAASIWVRAASEARISLPMSDYAIAAHVTEVSDDYIPDQPAEQRLTKVLRIAPLGADQMPASVVGDGSGTFRALPPGSSAEPKARKGKPVRRRRANSDAEYENLGREARTGGTSTYGSETES